MKATPCFKKVLKHCNKCLIWIGFAPFNIFVVLNDVLRPVLQAAVVLVAMASEFVVVGDYVFWKVAKLATSAELKRDLFDLFGKH